MSTVKELKTNGKVSVPMLFDDFFSKNLFDWNDRKLNQFELPKTNIVENENEFEIHLAVPGISKKDFDVTVNNNHLIISASKNDSVEDSNQKYRLKEFNYSKFERSFTLPMEVIDVKNIKAKYLNGILSIKLPKLKEYKERSFKKIEIS